MIQSLKSRKIVWLLCFMLIFAIGLSSGWILRSKNIPQEPQLLKEVKENNSALKLINPVLYLETTESSSDNLAPLQKFVVNYVSTAKNKGAASNISVYYRELATGLWTGVNEDDLYQPGSMLKVLVMESYLKAATDDSKLLEKELAYTGTPDPGQYYKPTSFLRRGSYTVTDLIQRMIIDSDNEADYLLFNLNRNAFNETYQTLELPPAPPDNQPKDFMSPHQYSVVFRVLYNASYLPDALSSQALQLLTKTTFNKGLVAGVPEGTVVAHKFGEHTTEETNGTIVSHELHDCGIIYRPGSPYLLCVMTKGEDFTKLEKVISDISKLVYDQVKKP
jgi:beta-lactamase class A